MPTKRPLANGSVVWPNWVQFKPFVPKEVVNKSPARINRSHRLGTVLTGFVPHSDVNAPANGRSAA